MTNRVVVTGLGVLSPFGVGVDTFWSSVKAGENAVDVWHPSGVENFPVKHAATIKSDTQSLVDNELAEFNLPKHIERRAIYALIAAKEAIADAQLSEQLAQAAIAVCSGVPELDDTSLVALAKQPKENIMNHALEERERAIERFSGIRCSNDVLATTLAQQLNTSGFICNVSGACAGATQAIGLAYRAIKRGEAAVVLCGGADSVLSIRTMSALHLLGATAETQRFSNQLCRPFDQDRSGLVAGEGGAMLVLESEQHARERGARIYAEVTGFGSSLDAYKVTAPHPQGEGAISAMNGALQSAGCNVSDVQYINAHGTSTPLNDVIETKAIKAVFGSHANSIGVSSTKSMIGHWIAAAGAPEAIATILAIRDQFMPATINLKQPQAELDLDYVMGHGRSARIDCALSNSFGFGGINASLAIARYYG
ncbi:beta-ketoacyl-[acyl-carrier-protein] synthase family protein [Pseudoalteromonas sp. NEC-BIFX-2020_002]|uniref:beta-ketoacyl-[acyl-carrier-protein] synthase family protein n=1 Tax=Pseudoalteromonas sp. NEC-BIFX-2020_002 TaxID=2732353 RepID=UPI0014775F01|nr:beta-ketoacyl-[acyl-carrier-protein] synthase family protein [Pseudoalteromonas sp. NEC-BIFX-2020_002]NNG41922.1 beta-ketoacyl-[acyl-carrier-protein] synthase family protein [Pseudoalteromonas sp. NEC-BIFX-2020_002]